ncbi:MAG: hypothetical protein ACXVIY_10090 [Mucilaginibacter sp.]
MAIYNIIYRSPKSAIYLWNGSSFDLLGKEDNGRLFYSGKSFDEDEVVEAIRKSRETARKQFPADRELKIEKAEIPVNNKDTKGGHRHHMTT